MNDTAVSKVLSVEDFHENPKESWDSLYEEASKGMVEPLQTETHLGFCRVLDIYNLPMDSCNLDAGKFAVLTVRVKDLGAEDEPVWEPLCEASVRGRVRATA